MTIRLCCVVAVGLFFQLTPTLVSALTLKAAKAPGSNPSAWEQPAEFSFTDNSNGDNAYSINAAIEGTLPYIIGETGQIKLSPWVAKNTDISKAQDKKGIDISYGFAAGDALTGFGYFTQLMATASYDGLKKSDSRQFEIKVDLINKALSLGGCGKNAKKGCTYWDLEMGLYSDNVYESKDNTGLGVVNGTKAIIKVTSNPFEEGHPLSQMGFGLTAQGQWDFDATRDRVEENRTLYKGQITWKFYDDTSKYKPSVELSRTVGADLLIGLSDQAYTKLAFKLEF